MSVKGTDPAAFAIAPDAVFTSRTLWRLVRLYLGLAGFGLSLALMVRARLGLGPWDVLHQGLARRMGLQIGWVVIVVSAAVLLLWIPLRLRPGLGTVSNVVLVGVFANVFLDQLRSPTGLVLRSLWLVFGISLNAIATALYIGARFGPGARDGLMVGIAERGYSIRVVRTAIELTALKIGFALGGTVGVGTVAYALVIGPLVQRLLPVFGYQASDKAVVEK
ncbi:MAG: hypothetical protein WCF24_09250 [Acidimicrobiales bacterium]